MADADKMRLERDQARQRATSPLKVAQTLLRELCGSNLTYLDPDFAAEIVTRVERAIIAERAGHRHMAPSAAVT
jgi:hypothetical protein